ncbi:MAG: DUF418 domain-containing protein [Parvularculaceae bacterium]|nr:DUF418 domain-containing protein [Parvularculaceae bacterium]
MSETIQPDAAVGRPAAGPVAGADRIDYLDILRGFAVMAIFIVNIKGMVMPFSYYMNPSLWGSPIEEALATAQKFLVDDKWRTTFSALYGAGLMMIWQRLETRGEDRSTLRRRNLWLMLFGAIHLFLIWIGDILLSYGTAGLVAMLFVRSSTTKLFIAGGGLLALGIVWSGGVMAMGAVSPEAAANMKPTMWLPTDESFAAEVAVMQGDIFGQVLSRLTAGIFMYLFLFLLGGGLPTTIGLMLLGMGLFRAGLYRGAWKTSVTLPLAIMFLGAAWALDYWQIAQLKASDYAFNTFAMQGWFAMIDGVLGAFGYGCLVSALVSMGIKFGPVAAVGRMAFTNYITCSLIGTTLAGGHAFGMFGEVSLSYLTAVTIATFVGMLIWSPLWLKAFRFGPLEWLWRSLVYGEVQRFRRA